MFIDRYTIMDEVVIYFMRIKYQIYYTETLKPLRSGISNQDIVI